MHRRFRVGPRGWAILAVAAVLAGGFGLVYWYVWRPVLRGEARYYRESSGLRRDLADRLEAKLAFLESEGAGRDEAVDEIFDLLRSTPVGDGEVLTWRAAPRSPERTAAAVKWARAAADEEAWMALMDARTAKENERGHIPIHFSQAEVEAFQREARAGRRP